MDSLHLPTIDFDKLGTLFVVYGVNILGALLIAIIGWWLASVGERLSKRALMSSSHMDMTVAAFLSSLVRYGLLAVVLVLMLQVVGIQATSLVAVLGATSLAIGLALQGTLSNMAAGVMLLIFRLFCFGVFFVVAGLAGTVRNLNLFMTELAGGDNVQVLIPNGQVWGQALTNNSPYRPRRVPLKLPVTFEMNVAATAARVRDYLEKDARVQKSPPPAVTTAALTGTGVELSIEAWTSSGEAGAVRADLMEFAMTVLHAKPQSAAA